jgi:hypothetical protein
MQFFRLSMSKKYRQQEQDMLRDEILTGDIDDDYFNVEETIKAIDDKLRIQNEKEFFEDVRKGDEILRKEIEEIENYRFEEGGEFIFSSAFFSTIIKVHDSNSPHKFIEPLGFLY